MSDLVRDPSGEVVLPSRRRHWGESAEYEPTLLLLGYEQLHRVQHRRAGRGDARLLRGNEHLSRQHPRRSLGMHPIVVLGRVDSGRRLVLEERAISRGGGALADLARSEHHDHDNHDHDNYDDHDTDDHDTADHDHHADDDVHDFDVVHDDDAESTTTTTVPTTTTAATRPSAPQGLSVSGANTTAALTWSPPTDSGIAAGDVVQHLRSAPARAQKARKSDRRRHHRNQLHGLVAVVTGRLTSTTETAVCTAGGRRRRT